MTKEAEAEDASTDTKPEDDAFSAVERGWGFPHFARTFPRHPELDELVGAFARGDYASVRERAPALADRADVDDDVRAAARTLRERIEPDPTSRAFFVLTAALLVFLSVWWITHDGKASHPSAEPPPKVEVVK